MTKTQFTRLLRRQLKAKGIKRPALARMAGVSESTVQAWEHRGTVPSVVNADALLRALGVRMVIGDPNGEDVGGE